MMYNKNNFYLATRATFKACRRPRRQPDYISYNRDGQISSEYWYSEEGVIRCSDHWSCIYDSKTSYVGVYGAFMCGKIASCFWRLRISDPYKNKRKDFLCGFVTWKHFKAMH